MNKTFGLQKYEVEQVARIVSEGYDTYVVGFVDGSERVVEKVYTSPPYYVGDVVQVIQVSGHDTIVRLIDRQKVVQKLANQTMKSFHQREELQVLATNVDQLFILMAADQKMTLAKLERYLLVFSVEAIDVHIVLTKSDLNDSCSIFAEEVKRMYPHVHVHVTSVYQEETVCDIIKLCQSGTINLFIGASGAGKSTLINALLGIQQERTGDVRQDGKGKHTTTTSKFICASKGDYYIIDTPGFKGIDTPLGADFNVLYEEIEWLATQCKFSNCHHEQEPGCAIQQAIAKGQLDAEKYARYLYNEEKLKKLTAYETRKAKAKQPKPKKKGKSYAKKDDLDLYY